METPHERELRYEINALQQRHDATVAELRRLAQAVADRNTADTQQAEDLTALCNDLRAALINHGRRLDALEHVTQDDGSDLSDLLNAPLFEPPPPLPPHEGALINGLALPDADA